MPGDEARLATYLSASPRILILGAGFAGTNAARQLDRRLRGTGAHVLLVDRGNASLFTPLLWTVADGRTAPSDVMVPIRDFQGRFSFVHADVEEIDIAGRTVRTSVGSYPYDILVVALGSITTLPPVPGIHEHALGFRYPVDAIRLRNRLIQAVEVARHTADAAARSALLSFAVVGGGDTGVELAATIHDYLHAALFDRYPELKGEQVRIIVLERAERLTPMERPDLSSHAQQMLERSGIEVHTGTTVEGITADGVQTSAGDFPARTVFWAAGISAPPVVRALPVEHAPNGAVIVDTTLRVPGHPEIIVVGDSAWIYDAEGKPVPPTAQAARVEGIYVAKSIANSLRGGPARPFTYRSLGHLALLGLHTGLGEVGPIEVRGFPAWLLWHAYYLYRIPTWGNRVRIVADLILAAIFGREAAQVPLNE
ncbi:MAG TPA: NAD(P)/FAD-dependent oxidoreductase [Chloroflexota bacterium]|nr:NAD(P)/FAD-dependent oxidoreductase [Chloroflexota bacterium]